MPIVQKSVTLPSAVAEQAGDYAHKTGRTFSSLVRISLEKFIKEEAGV
jgi:predicted DNA-binding protein